MPVVPADVSHEAYGWFVFPPDTAVEAVGNISATSATLVIEMKDGVAFESGDVGETIVIAGAGTDGADLITTIASVDAPQGVTLDDPAEEDAAGVQVRWRLTRFIEDTTDEDADADENTNTTLKSPEHSRYSTTRNDCDWDKQNGWMRLGTESWVAQPLRQNLIRPSGQFINSLIYALDRRIGSRSSLPIRIFAGIWDNTPGQQKFLEGKPIALNAEVIGSPGATVSRTYSVIFYTGWGLKIGTSAVTVDAPATFTNTEYVALSWRQPIGTVRTEIYRHTGGTIHLLRSPYPQSSYQDKGATLKTVMTIPGVDTIRPRAYVETTYVSPAQFSLAPARYGEWQRTQLNIAVPYDYDMSKTTDKQWYVIGIKEVVYNPESESESESESGTIDIENRILQVDKLSIDDKLGTFTRSPWDFLAKRGIASAPTSGNQGTTPGGEPGIPPGGTGIESPGVPWRVPPLD